MVGKPISECPLFKAAPLMMWHTHTHTALSTCKLYDFLIDKGVESPASQHECVLQMFV